jgi:hypothetical protein
MRIARRITLVFLALLLVACATNQIVRDSYRALSVGGHTYDTGMTGIATLHRNGVVDDDVKAETIKLGGYYHDAYHSAVEALSLYAETGGKEGDIQVKLLMVGEQLGKFLAYINPILIKNGMEAIQ